MTGLIRFSRLPDMYQHHYFEFGASGKERNSSLFWFPRNLPQPCIIASDCIVIVVIRVAGGLLGRNGTQGLQAHIDNAKLVKTTYYLLELKGTIWPLPVATVARYGDCCEASFGSKENFAAGPCGSSGGSSGHLLLLVHG